MMGVEDSKEQASYRELASLVRSSRAVTRALGLLIAVMFVLLVAMQVQLQNRNRQLDRIETATNELVQFTRSLQEDDEPDPELQRVFTAVFDTLALLCEEFPENNVCVQDQGG